jgi:hypothetical protein
MTNQQEIFYKEVLRRALKNGPTISRRELQALCSQFGMKYIPMYAQKNKVGRGAYDLSGLSIDFLPQGTIPILAEEDKRSDADIEEAIDERFAALDRMAFGVAEGKYHALIASGNPGIGKTYTLEYILEGAAHEGKITLTVVHGFVRATGLYRLLWETRESKSVLLLDDSDSVFDDEISLNLLKGALDSTKRRNISWRSEKVFETDGGEEIPNNFDYNGSVVFITNKDFDREIQRENKIKPHLEALVSRSYYLDLNLAFPRELMIRIKSVVSKTDMLNDLSEDGKIAIISYMEKNMSHMRELSLRMALKLANLWRGSKTVKSFEQMAGATCLKRK